LNYENHKENFKSEYTLSLNSGNDAEKKERKEGSWKQRKSPELMF
jgi:hypothetical protein